jgi:hypothetical protein
MRFALKSTAFRIIVENDRIRGGISSVIMATPQCKAQNPTLSQTNGIEKA